MSIRKKKLIYIFTRYRGGGEGALKSLENVPLCFLKKSEASFYGNHKRICNCLANMVIYLEIK